MHTVYLFDGDLGGEEMLVRTDLCDPTATIEINHCDGEGWQDSGHQSVEAMAREWKLKEIAKLLAAQACHWDEEHFQCNTKSAEHALPWRRLCQFGVVTGELAAIGTVIANDDKLSGGNTYEVALDWMSQGFSAADVAGWTEAGCWDAWTAKALADAGLTPEQAIEVADAVCEHADEGSPITLIDEICNGDVDIQVLLDWHADSMAETDCPDNV